MTPKEHKQRHIKLHRALDELIVDFINHPQNLPSKTTVIELLRWSHQQTIRPVEEGIFKKVHQ